MTRIPLFLTLTATLALAQPPAAPRRLALVIGNADYTTPDSRLVNSVRDAESMRATLTQLGFTVQFAVNAKFPDLEAAIDRFIAATRPGDVALFYYSGHGVQLQDQNYLLPVDFQATTAIDAKYKAYAVTRVLENLEDRGVALQIIILDACRNNPFTRGWRGDAANRGLRPMTAGRETYIAFATAPGGVASDNPGGRNGLFTEELVTALNKPGLTLDQVFQTVRGRVRERSANKQIPWSTTSIERDFFFRPKSQNSTPDPPPATDAALELAVWQEAQRLNTAAAFSEYLRQYPTGRFAAFAKARTVPPSELLAPGMKKVNPRDGLTYVWIPPGKFMMGCSPGDKECDPDENPAHEVEITKGFWMGQTEVTQAAFENLNKTNPSRYKGPNLPVETYKFGDAITYCEAAGLRLPTEAEWEYAARAGTKEARYGDLDQIAWHRDNSKGQRQTVATKSPNPWGLYDMLGNAWEWVKDSYEEKYYGQASRQDPVGPVNPPHTRIVLRGGSTSHAPQLARASSRSWSLSWDKYHVGSGFRCAGDLP